MIKNVDKRHLLVVGKSETDRREFVDKLVVTTNKVVYRFPENIRSFDEYIDHVRILFPFVPTNWHEENPKKWTRNQVWDFHLDWTDNTHSILIVIDEFGRMEENWKLEILRHYITKSYDQERADNSRLNFQLIVTQEEEEHILDRLSTMIGLKEGEKRTERQVLLGKLEVVNLDWI